MAVKINIQYAMAYQPPFEVIHIGDASRGGKYLCLGCNEEMIPRKGQTKRHHFAHKAGLEECNPDNALHETAKAAICQGFMSTVQLRQEYLVQFPCSRCRQPIGVNVASQGAAIATERSVIQGTKPIPRWDVHFGVLKKTERTPQFPTSPLGPNWVATDSAV